MVEIKPRWEWRSFGRRFGAAEARLSSEDRTTILELGKGSNSIELKLSGSAEGHRATIRSLKLDPVEAQPRQAFFFDTPALDLYKAGVVVRARRIRGGRADTVVKLRPVDPATIATELKRSSRTPVTRPWRQRSNARPVGITAVTFKSRDKVGLPKRQKAGDHQEPAYPFEPVAVVC